MLVWPACDAHDDRTDADEPTVSAADAAPTPDASANKPTASDGGTTATADSSAAQSDSDGGKTPEPAAAIPTRFQVTNTGDSPVLLGASDCYARWLSLSEGDTKQRWDESCLCMCGSGMVCGCPGVCPRATELLMPTLKAELEWDGVVRDVQPSECFQPRVPAHGTELTATACWDGPIDSGKAPSCSSSDFKYGEDTVVQLTAAGEAAQPHQISVTLTNGTTDPIEIVADHCGEQGWLKLDMGEHSSATSGCGCTCSADKQKAICPACGACADDVLKTLAPGDRATITWDGHFNYTYPSGCTERYTYPEGLYVDAKLCWRKVGETTEHCTATGTVLGTLDALTATAQ
jgi:hypothetical protein